MSLSPIRGWKNRKSLYQASKMLQLWRAMNQLVHLDSTVVLLELQLKQMDSLINKLKGPADVLAQYSFSTMRCEELEVSIAIFLP